MEETGLTVCHTAHVSLRARLRSGEAFDEPLVVAPSRCEICGSAPHPSLAHASAGEIVQAYELLEVKETPLKTHWREVPLAQDLEGEPSMSSPLRICAALCAEEMDTFRSRKLTLELRVVADPLDLAQRSRFAIYPPWQLGPQLRFSWRLETRKVELMDQTPRRSQPRPRRPRSLHGIGGVGGGFGSGSTSLDDGYEDDCQAPQPAPQPFQLLSNCLDAEAEMPTGLLLPLRRHQLQSLAWMQACEARSEPLLLGASREFLPAVQPPHAAQQILVEALGCRGVARVQRAFQPKGGLLADHVGSGKTAVTLALVASDRGTAKRSLVMMPGRLLQQWQQEVTKFLEPNLLDVQLWDGGDISDPEDFSRPSLLLAPIELLSPKRRELNKDGNNTRRAANVLSSLSLSRIVVDEFHENLETALYLQELKDSETMLWGLTGTPCLDDFANVAKLVRACSDIDLLVFRRQLDAKDLAQRTLDYLARANADLKGLEVQEELVALYHTPAERAIYEGAASSRRGPRSESEKDETLGSELLQLCSHFRLHGPTDCDAETESVALLRRRHDACETSRAWLLLAAQRMEICILQDQREGILPTVVAEQYAQLLVEVDGKPYAGFAASDQLVSQVAGAKAARQGASKRSKRHERDADDLILRAILEVRSGADDDWKEKKVSFDANALELLEEVKQAKEAFRQRSHEHAFLSAMLDAAEAQNFQCPVCLNEFPPTERAMLAACAHLFCLGCADTLVRSVGECALCRQSLRKEALDEILRVREPGAMHAEERQERQRLGRFGSKIFHVVRKLRDIEAEDPTARAIVFVQWKSLRRKLAEAFTEFEVPFVCLEERYDASSGMVLNSFWQRDDVVTSFQNAPPDSSEGPKVLLLSLQDAASGTNLTRANHVLLVHPMLASTHRLSVAYELQALGRCLRLGQRRRVYLWRFVTLGTVEEDLSYRHQQELWQSRPELIAARAEARAVRSRDETGEAAGAHIVEDLDLRDLDDLFW